MCLNLTPITRKLKFFITLAISKCYGKVRVLFFPRDNSDFTRQLARFTRSWSSGKMLAFEPRGFLFEPVGMRYFFTSIPKQKVLTFRHYETFRLCETFFWLREFFSKFFKCPQRILSIFDILQENEC